MKKGRRRNRKGIRRRIRKRRRGGGGRRNRGAQRGKEKKRDMKEEEEKKRKKNGWSGNFENKSFINVINLDRKAPRPIRSFLTSYLQFCLDLMSKSLQLPIYLLRASVEN